MPKYDPFAKAVNNLFPNAPGDEETPPSDEVPESAATTWLAGWRSQQAKSRMEGIKTAPPDIETGATPATRTTTPTSLISSITTGMATGAEWLRQKVDVPFASALLYGGASLLPGEQEIETRFNIARAQGKDPMTALTESYNELEMSNWYKFGLEFLNPIWFIIPYGKIASGVGGTAFKALERTLGPAAARAAELAATKTGAALTYPIRKPIQLGVRYAKYLAHDSPESIVGNAVVNTVEVLNGFLKPLETKVMGLDGVFRDSGKLDYQIFQDLSKGKLSDDLLESIRGEKRWERTAQDIIANKDKLHLDEYAKILAKPDSKMSFEDAAFMIGSDLQDIYAKNLMGGRKPTGTVGRFFNDAMSLWRGTVLYTYNYVQQNLFEDMFRTMVATAPWSSPIGKPWEMLYSTKTLPNAPIQLRAYEPDFMAILKGEGNLIIVKTRGLEIIKAAEKRLLELKGTKDVTLKSEAKALKELQSNWTKRLASEEFEGIPATTRIQPLSPSGAEAILRGGEIASSDNSILTRMFQKVLGQKVGGIAARLPAATSSLFDRMGMWKVYESAYNKLYQDIMKTATPRTAQYMKEIEDIVKPLTNKFVELGETPESAANIVNQLLHITNSGHIASVMDKYTDVLRPLMEKLTNSPIPMELKPALANLGVMGLSKDISGIKAAAETAKSNLGTYIKESQAQALKDKSIELDKLIKSMNLPKDILAEITKYQKTVKDGIKMLVDKDLSFATDDFWKTKVLSNYETAEMYQAILASELVRILNAGPQGKVNFFKSIVKYQDAFIKENTIVRGRWQFSQDTADLAQTITGKNKLFADSEALKSYLAKYPNDTAILHSSLTKGVTPGDLWSNFRIQQSKWYSEMFENIAKETGISKYISKTTQIDDILKRQTNSIKELEEEALNIAAGKDFLGDKFATGIVDVPILAKGYTRFYRGQPSATTSFGIEDVTQIAPETVETIGRWFTQDIESARAYMGSSKEGVLRYIDIPNSEISKFRPSGESLEFTPTGKEREYIFLPKSQATGAKVFSSRSIGGVSEANRRTISQLLHPMPISTLDRIKRITTEPTGRVAGKVEAGAVPKLQGFKIVTGIPYIDDAINKPGYYAKSKGYAVTIETMTPDEYLNRSDKLLGISRVEANRLIEPELVKKYSDMMKSGTEFDIPHLDYIAKEQEGRHRALAAKMAGIDTMPIAIVNKAAEAAPKFYPMVYNSKSGLLNINPAYLDDLLKEAKTGSKTVQEDFTRKLLEATTPKVVKGATISTVFEPAQTMTRQFGGKRFLVTKIAPEAGYTTGNVIDPFFGTGAVPLTLKTSGNVAGRVIGYEANPDIVNLFRVAKSNPDELYNRVKSVYAESGGIIDKVKAEALRDKFNTGISDEVEKYATYMILTRHAVMSNLTINKAGKISAAMKKVNPSFSGKWTPGYESEIRASIDNAKLADVGLATKNSWIEAVKSAKSGDTLYLDPPYPGRTANYGGEARVGIWTAEDDAKLISEAKQAADRGVRVVFSHGLEAKSALKKAGFDVKDIVHKADTNLPSYTEVLATAGPKGIGKAPIPLDIDDVGIASVLGSKREFDIFVNETKNLLKRLEPGTPQYISVKKNLTSETAKYKSGKFMVDDIEYQHKLSDDLQKLGRKYKANGGTISDYIDKWFHAKPIDNADLQMIGKGAIKNPEYMQEIHNILLERYKTGYIRIFRGSGLAKNKALDREFTNVTSSRLTAKDFEDTWLDTPAKKATQKDVDAYEAWWKEKGQYYTDYNPPKVGYKVYSKEGTIGPELDDIIIKVDDVVSIGAVGESELIVSAKILRDRILNPISMPVVAKPTTNIDNLVQYITNRTKFAQSNPEMFESFSKSHPIATGPIILDKTKHQLAQDISQSLNQVLDKNIGISRELQLADNKAKTMAWKESQGTFGNYSITTNLDQLMMKIFPFWYFPSRSIPYYIKAGLNKPAIPMGFYRYEAYTKTDPDSPPALLGYVKLPGSSGNYMNLARPLYMQGIFGTEQFTSEHLPGPESTIQALSSIGLGIGPQYAQALEVLSNLQRSTGIGPALTRGEPKPIVPQERWLQQLSGAAGVAGGRGLKTSVVTNFPGEMFNRNVDKELASNNIDPDLATEEQKLQAAKSMQARSLYSAIAPQFKYRSAAELKYRTDLNSTLTELGVTPKMREEANEQGFSPLMYLNGETRKALTDSHPEWDVWKHLSRIMTHPDEKPYYDKTEYFYNSWNQVADRAEKNQEASTLALLQGNKTYGQWRDDYQSIQQEKSSAWEMLYKDANLSGTNKSSPGFALVDNARLDEFRRLYKKAIPPIHPEDLALQVYRDINPSNKEYFIPAENAIDWEKWEQDRTTFLESVDSPIRDYILRMSTRSTDPVEADYNAGRVMRRDYWNIKDNVISELGAESLYNQIRLTSDERTLALLKNNPKYKAAEKLTDVRRQGMRMRLPELDAHLTRWDYVTKPLTPAGWAALDSFELLPVNE